MNETRGYNMKKTTQVLKMVVIALSMITFATAAQAYDYLKEARKEIRQGNYDQASRTLASRGRHDLAGDAYQANQDLQNGKPGVAIRDLNAAMAVRRLHNVENGTGNNNYDHLRAAEAVLRAAGRDVANGNNDGAAANVKAAEQIIEQRNRLDLGGKAHDAEQALDNWVPGNGKIPEALRDLETARQLRKLHDEGF